jgi:hypothetical protein
VRLDFAVIAIWIVALVFAAIMMWAAVEVGTMIREHMQATEVTCVP